MSVDERELHALIKAWRHGRASRTLGQVLGDAYFVLFSLLLFGAMTVNALLNSAHAAASCTTQGCLTGRSLLPWAALLTLGTMTLAIARILGPVLASAPEGFWLMDAPISRTRLLGGRLIAVVCSALGLGLVAGSLLALLSGSDAPATVGWGLATGGFLAALMAFAAREQSAERTVVISVLRAVCAVAAVAVVAWMVAIAAGMVAPIAPLPAIVPWAIAGASVLVTIVFGLGARARLNEIRRARLLSGGSLVAGMQGAMFALDLGLARDILVERDAVARGFVRATPGRGSGVQALIWRDVQRLTRFPKPFLALGASALVPYATDALGLSFVMPFLASLALVAALVPFFGSLRVLSRTGGLARTFPFSTRELRNATMVVPGVLAAIWTAVVFPAVLGVAGGTMRPFLDALLTAVAIGAAGLLGAVRWQTAKQTDFNAPMMATNAGALPPNLIFNLFRGFDICALVTAPIMLGAPAWVALGVAAIAFFFLGISTAELQDEAEESKRQLDQEKATRSGEKIKITRPQR